MERINLGEEVDDFYVAGTLEVGIEQWNHVMVHLRDQLDDPALGLKALEQSGCSLDEAGEILAQMQERRSSLQDIRVSTTGRSFERLGGTPLMIQPT